MQKADLDLLKALAEAGADLDIQGKFIFSNILFKAE